MKVTDPIAAARPYDYADAFELRLEGPDHCSPEEWVRAGVDATPTWIKRIAGNADGLGSVRIVESTAAVVVLEDSDRLMDTVMVARNVEPGRRVLTTILRYRRPVLTRGVWAIVGILHRRTARRVVTGGLRQATGPSAAAASSLDRRAAPEFRRSLRVVRAEHRTAPSGTDPTHAPAVPTSRRSSCPGDVDASPSVVLRPRVAGAMRGLHVTVNPAEDDGLVTPAGGEGDTAPDPPLVGRDRPWR
ncbi:hypothetical protein [Blastococcus xanthinilyticus]|uniref:hypothetical protein n=1 Tax=Blastococcus xanthinilyticus TaxID=1564164 RepID=UPI00141345E4|nr:hypothetical protein [Blastococcus xanthinilyticus]